MVRKGSPQLFVVGDQKRATRRAALAGAFVKAKYLFNNEDDGKGGSGVLVGCKPGSPIAGVRRSRRSCCLVASLEWSSGAPDASAAGRQAPNCCLMKVGQSGTVGVEDHRKVVGAAG